MRSTRPAPKSSPPKNSLPASRSAASITATASASSRSPSPSTSPSSTRPTPRAATGTSSTAPTRAPRNGPSTGRSISPPNAAVGRHYSVASPEWADKPYGFANFLRSARFANSLYNGQLLSKHASAAGGFRYVTYRVRLSRQTEQGMYDMKVRAMTRSHKRGFVIPSQNEWIKAAYYDPSGGGKYSYWQYPTNPGAFGDEGAAAPHSTTLDPDQRRRHQRLDPAAGELPRRKSAGPELVPLCLQRRNLRQREPLRNRPDRHTQRPTRAASRRSARPRPPRPGARSTRAATRSSGPTRSPRRRRVAAAPTAESGDGCTAASPTPPSTSSGSRRSACSRRTTPSTPPPIRGWASASACSATSRSSKR